MVIWEGVCEHGVGSDGPFLYPLLLVPALPTQQASAFGSSLLISSSCPFSARPRPLLWASQVVVVIRTP